MEETYIDRMKTEKAELEQRITKLLAFMESDKFAELEAIDKRLLRMQYSGMETYRTALAFRLLRVDMKRYDGDIKALKAQAEKWKEEGKTDAEIASMLTDEVGKIPEIGNANNDALWMLWKS